MPRPINSQAFGPQGLRTSALLVLGSGDRVLRGFCLHQAAGTWPAALVNPEPLTWQAPFVVDHEVADLHDPEALDAAVDALARRHLVTAAPTGEYVGASDATLGCSRSGLASLLLWRALRSLGRDGLAERARRCLATAAFAEQQLAALGLNPWRHPDSITVVFDRPPEQICRRWHLAVQGYAAHIICCPHVLPEEQIAALCRDLATSTEHARRRRRAIRGRPRALMRTRTVLRLRRPGDGPKAARLRRRVDGGGSS